MRASLLDETLLQHDDFVAVNDGAEPMRNNKRCRLSKPDPDLFLNDAFGLAVERRRRFIEHHNTRVLHEHPSGADALAFTATEARYVKLHRYHKPRQDTKKHNAKVRKDQLSPHVGCVKDTKLFASPQGT